MRQALGFLCVFFFCGLASAQTPDCAALTHQALELSGFNQSLDHMAEIMGSDQFMRQVRGQESQEEFSAIFIPIIRKEFNGSLLRQQMESRMAANCNLEQITQTVERLQTPFVARMLSLEAATSTPEGQKNIERYIKIAQLAPPTDDRMDALDAIDAGSGSSDLVTDFTLAFLTGMMTGVGAPADVIDQLRSRRKELKAQMQNNVELSMSVTYHGVTRLDLQQYAKELAAPPLNRFYRQVSKTFVEITQERARAIGQDLKKALPAPKS
jgi:predicted secreted protein